MFSQLRLKNFRQHEDRVFNFSGGLNVMRGPNEGGKSTVIEGILYLLFGSGALSDTLANVVTYGKSPKDLRVEGDFAVDGVQYTGYRAASGAELRYGDKLVTGQSNVTAFVESLLGAKAVTVRKLMIAEQNAIRGVLSSESSAGALIEQLAELGIIETYIEKIQHQLPNGPTKAQEATVTLLINAVEEKPEQPSTEALEACKLRYAEALDAYIATEAGAEELKSSAQLAEATLRKDTYTQARRDELKKRIETLKAVQKPADLTITGQHIKDAERQESDADYAAAVEKERQRKFVELPETWTGTVESAEEFIADQKNIALNCNKRVADLRVAIASKNATAINEGVCSFCKEDISQRPEVLVLNSAVEAAVAAMTTDMKEAEQASARAVADAATVSNILKVHDQNSRSAKPEFWEPVGLDLPCKYNWVGPETVDSQSLSASSAQLRKLVADHASAYGKWEYAQKELAETELPTLLSDSEVAELKATVEKYTVKLAEINLADQAVKSMLSALKLEEVKYDNAVASYDAAVLRAEASVKNVEDAKKTLDMMIFNNELIKDLREARSEIRRRLWRSVTSAISLYFSRIRKVDTVIAQSEDGFTQNGRPIKGLSGSAMDMLGLAVRAALVKTFMPTAPLLVVDEPFSGCDDDREVAGIGVLHSLGFDQTILVTHSDLADAVATNLIQL